MRLLIQRISRASVTIEGEIRSAIGKGLMVLVGIEEADTQEDIDWLTGKL
ncbi:MAG: D-aminoacyl-tRNA deacylase, partial [Alistipes sp.]|nr:D-aminoacyl-tRNA deacylase [Alistipes sp.]